MADNLTTFMRRLSENPGSLDLLGLSGTIWACTGTALPLQQTPQPWLKLRPPQCQASACRRNGTAWKTNSHGKIPVSYREANREYINSDTCQYARFRPSQALLTNRSTVATAGYRQQTYIRERNKDILMQRILCVRFL